MDCTSFRSSTPAACGGRTATTAWLRGVGFGLGLTSDLRVDFGYKLDDIPDSFQVVLRLGHTF